MSLQSKGGILSKACDYIRELRQSNQRLQESLKEVERIQVDNELCRQQVRLQAKAACSASFRGSTVSPKRPPLKIRSKCLSEDFCPSQTFCLLGDTPVLLLKSPKVWKTTLWRRGSHFSVSFPPKTINQRCQILQVADRCSLTIKDLGIEHSGALPEISAGTCRGSSAQHANLLKRCSEVLHFWGCCTSPFLLPI